MDGQSTNPRRQARSLVLDGALPDLPQGWGCLHSTYSHFIQLAPSSPCPIHGMWAAERGKAILESGGYRRVLEAKGGGYERLPSGSLTLAALTQDGKAWLPTERQKSHSQLPHETSTLRLTTSKPLFASELAPVLKKAMVQDREAESAGCVI